MAIADKPLRRDAERNRQRILEAARELFADRGLAVTLDDIAHYAGLGVGTVYRRFGSRDELVDALFEERMIEIVALADEALADDDPWRGLTTFLHRLVALQAADRGLREVLLRRRDGCERVRCIREEMSPRAEELVRRAHAAGKLRADFAAADLPLLQMMVGAVADVCPLDRPELWRRYLELLLDGLRAKGTRRAPLTEPPLDFEALDEVMCQWRPPRWDRTQL
jgi:AcrR family transcriptional regulator